MWIKELQFKAFGPFTDCQVSLAPGLNILFGPNEAGKSSALRGIRSLLYGIAVQSNDNFIHDHKQMRIGAVLAGKEGQRLEFFRRKGRKHTLRDGNDAEPLDDDVLDAYLGAVDEEFFLSFFGIDHERLREGGREVVAGKGKVGDLLFSAGGVTDLSAQQQWIDNAERELFKSGGASKPKINHNISQFKHLQSELKTLQASSDEWRRHDQELARLGNRREEVDVALRELKAKAGRLGRIQTALPTLSRWKSESDELKTLAGATLLSENFAGQSVDAQRRLSISLERKQDASAQKERLEKEIKEDDVPEELLAQAATIESLYQRLGSYIKAKQDRGNLVKELVEARHDAQEVLRQLGRSESLDEIEQHRLPDDKLVFIRELINRYEAVAQRHRSAKGVCDRSTRKMEELEHRLEGRQPPEDLGNLRKAVQEGQTDLKGERELADRERAAEQLALEVEAALRRLPPWSGTLSELEGLAVASGETVEQFDSTMQASQNRGESLAQQLREAGRNLEKVQQKLIQVEQGDEVPSEAELAQIRRTRDTGWLLVQADWKKQPSDQSALEEFLAKAKSGDDLGSAFESTLRGADAVADRLRREADRVANKSELDSQRAMFSARIEEIQRQQKALEVEQAQQLSDWQYRWKEAGITPLTPREMRGWLREYEKALLSGKNLRIEQATADRLREQSKLAREKMIAALAPSESEHELEGMKYEELVELGQLRLDQSQAATASYKQLVSQIEISRNDVGDTKEELRLAAGDMEAWRSEWAAAMQLLQLAQSATVEQASKVLENLAELFAKHREAESINRRIRGIDRDEQEFTSDFQELASKIAPDLAGLSLEEGGTQLNARLAEARKAQQRSESLAEQLAEQVKKLREAESSILETEAELGAMCEEAHCEQVEDLAGAERKSARKRELQLSVTSLVNQILPLSAGQGIEAFAAEAEGEDPDQLAPQIEEMEGQINRLTEERDQLLRLEQQEKDELKRMDGNSAAAEKANERAFLITELQENFEEFAVLRVASAVLKRAIESYRKRAEGPIVGIASEVFRTLTRGSFAGLQADFDEKGDPVLLGVRPDGRVPLGVAGMSEGTQDQLYLALRIATLEHWFAYHEPVPFIVDDVLLSFDDERAEAALLALAELSKKTQVLFFTHHDHLVKLAATVLENGASDSAFQINTEWATNGVLTMSSTGV